MSPSSGSPSSPLPPPFLRPRRLVLLGAMAKAGAVTLRTPTAVRGGAQMLADDSSAVPNASIAAVTCNTADEHAAAATATVAEDVSRGLEGPPIVAGPPFARPGCCCSCLTVLLPLKSSALGCSNKKRLALLSAAPEVPPTSSEGRLVIVLLLRRAGGLSVLRPALEGFDSACNTPAKHLLFSGAPKIDLHTNR